MIDKVSDFIGKHQLLSSDDLHLVGLSGGADSVALLLVLQHLGYRIEAAHCNFHLRGAESDRDEKFVKTLCEERYIPFHVIHFDTEEYASLHKVSIEMAARELRYGYFHQLCQDIGASKVCVAHHRDDAVETFLMNLLRGSGIHGLTGIRPHNGIIVRPLLCVSRQEIEDFLHSVGQKYVTDSTNLADDVLRNKIRHQVMPTLKELNPKAAENIGKSAYYLQEAEKIIDKAIAIQEEELIHRSANKFSQEVSIPQLLRLPSPEFFLHGWLSAYGFNSHQTDQMFSHLSSTSGKTFNSSTHTLVIDRETMILAPLLAPMKSMKIPETGRYRYGDDILFEFQLSDDHSISKSSDCVTLDAGKIDFPLTIRPVQEGDRFCPLGMDGHRLVSDFMTDRKISVLDKRRQLVVTDSHGAILWLVGLRPDNRFRVTERTSKILQMTIFK